MIETFALFRVDVFNDERAGVDDPLPLLGDGPQRQHDGARVRRWRRHEPTARHCELPQQLPAAEYHDSGQQTVPRLHCGAAHSD